MLTNIFESRNKTFLNLVKLGDYLGRSLRENVEIFSVENDEVTYLTESGHVIKGTFGKYGLGIQDIEVQDAGIFEDKKLYSNMADKKVSNLLADILENDLSNARKSFDSILSLWETKLKFDRTKTRLQDKASRFDESFKITSTPEFERVAEFKGELVKLLKENADYVKIPEIRSTIKLSSVISKSFNLPRITLDQLQESSQFSIPTTLSHTLYDHLCKQELLAKELVESKDNLDAMWMTNEKVQKLPSYLFESNENIMHLVADIISEVPYFAMATKKQLNSLIEGNIDLISENIKITNKDVKNLVSTIYELKKPVRNYIVEMLNDKYGINVQNLNSIPTFDSLVKSHSLIFESLSKLSPKNSNLRRTLSEFADFVKDKGGVEAIDVSDFLSDVFKEANYESSINETSLMNYLNFDRVADDLGKIGQVLKMIQAGVAGGAMPGVQGSAQGMAQEMPEEGGEGEYESDGGDETAGMEPEEDQEEDMPSADDEQNPMAAMDADDAADEVRGEEDSEDMEGMEGEEMPDEEGEEEMPEGGEEDIEFTERDDLIDHMKELEELISSLRGDLGVEGGDEDGDDEVEVDTGEGDDEEEEGEEGMEGDDEEEEDYEEEEKEED
jgi:hypothetical protein